MEEHLTREGVIARVQRRELARQLEDVSIAGEPVEQLRRTVTASSGVGRFLAGIARR
jgi:hypothetical protein